MEEKIKEFKKLKRQLESLYEKQQELNKLSCNYKTVIDDIKAEIKQLEKNLNIPEMEEKLRDLKMQLSDISDNINLKQEQLVQEKELPSRFEVFIGEIFDFPFSFSILGIWTMILSFITAATTKYRDKNKIKTLEEEIEQAYNSEEHLTYLEGSYTANLEKAQNNPILVKLYVKREELNSSYADTELCNSETNDEIMSVEAKYNSLGLEIATELLSMSDKESLSNEEIASILPELKAILEAHAEEKLANKILLQ